MRKNRGSRKKMWALLLAVLLVVTQMPVMALAEAVTPVDQLILDEDGFEHSTATESNADETASDSNWEGSGDKGSSGELAIITSWSFIDSMDYLSGDELILATVSQEKPADLDTVLSMLPTQIDAAIKGTDDTQIVDITGWSCPAYRQDADGGWPVTGEYLFTASLADGYLCSPLPTVKVRLGGAVGYGIGDPIYANGVEITVSNGGNVRYESGSGFTLERSGDYTINGTWGWGIVDDPLVTAVGSKKAVITVPSDVIANITFSEFGVTIDTIDVENACAFAVESGGTANITLQDTVTLASGSGRAGLEVPDGATVNITQRDRKSVV